MTCMGIIWRPREKCVWHRLPSQHKQVPITRRSVYQYLIYSVLLYNMVRVTSPHCVYPIVLGILCLYAVLYAILYVCCIRGYCMYAVLYAILCVILIIYYSVYIALFVISGYPRNEGN